MKEDKPMMDKYMAKLVSLGILLKNNTTHTSPVIPWDFQSALNFG